MILKRRTDQLIWWRWFVKNKDSLYKQKRKVKKTINMKLSILFNKIKQTFIVKFSLLLLLLFVCFSKFYCIYYVLGKVSADVCIIFIETSFFGCLLWSNTRNNMAPMGFGSSIKFSLFLPNTSLKIFGYCYRFLWYWPFYLR